MAPNLNYLYGARLQKMAPNLNYMAPDYKNGTKFELHGARLQKMAPNLNYMAPDYKKWCQI
jgi:hypothetical protein